MRTFRLDRIEHVWPAGGTFAVPEGFDPAEAVRQDVPWRYRVAVHVQGAPDDVRVRLPRRIATVEPDGDGWVLVRLRAERLDWLPAVLAGLGMPFVVAEPPELIDVVRAWADRLSGWVVQGESGLRGRAES
jgi:predicted DNA-binding transcriptional regulator YafY